MPQETKVKPILVWDGDCGFCRRWIGKWQKITGDRVVYEPYQTASARYPHVPLNAFQRSVQLILPNGERHAGALAVFMTLAMVPGHGGALWAYRHVPGFAPLAEFWYRLVSHHRGFFSKFS